MQTNISVPILSEKDNKIFNCLLKQYANGVYWQCEGWDAEHERLLPKAEKSLQRFFNKKLSKEALLKRWSL